MKCVYNRPNLQICIMYSHLDNIGTKNLPNNTKELNIVEKKAESKYINMLNWKANEVDSVNEM